MPNRYQQIIEAIFAARYQEGSTEIPFERSDIINTAAKLGIPLPKNLGDVLYSFRYRASLPESITRHAPEGFEWIIRSIGRSRYQFTLIHQILIVPSSILAETKILDSTPGMIHRYALNDEQSLLAKIRYNRLIDIFTGLTCYSLQNHLRTTVTGIGQVETDEIYIGLDKRGAHYVMPVQAKAGTDRIGIVQIEQDMAVCGAKFPDLICRPMAAQLMSDDLITLFEFENTELGLRVTSEKHYRLVADENLSPEDLQNYRNRAD